MSIPWKTVALREVMMIDLDKVRIEPMTNYEMAGVYSFGRGLFRREAVLGANTSYKFFYRLKADHVVMSQLFGWEGALALSSDEYAGLFVSPQFPTFLCESSRLDRHYLGWLMRKPSFWEDLGTRTNGMGDRRRTLNPEALLNCTIPLPPLEEQRRIVTRIETLAAKIEEAQELRRQAMKEVDRLLITMAHRADLDEATKLRNGWTKIKLGDVIRQVEDVHPVCPDTSYSNLGIYSFGKGLFRKPPIQGLSTSAKVLYRVRADQFIYNRLFAFEGSYGMVSDEFDGYFVSNEYPTFECDTGRVKVEFLYAYFKSPSIWSEVATGSKGLGDRRQRVHPTQVLNHHLMLPPLEWQNRIGLVMTKVDALKLLQAETAAELDAILPSVLDKAFKGGL